MLCRDSILSGSQGFSSEFLRYAKHQPERGEAPPQHVLLPAVTATLQAAFRARPVPKEDNGGLITPVFKKGASLDTSNYRPIAVTEPLLRLYAGILNERLLAYTEAQGLRVETLTGFRPGYSTVHKLFALQHCIDKAKRAKKPLFACFLDLKGAFERVQRPMLWQVLQRLGVCGEMLATVKSLHEDSELLVNINGRVGPAVSSQTGVRQDCPLSPTLSGLFADSLHWYLQLYCPDDGFALADGTLVPDLGYADDFVLLAVSAAGLQRLLDAAGRFLASMAMVISIPKTFVLVFNLAFSGPYQWTINGAALQIVSQVKYPSLVFHCEAAFSPSFLNLKQKMYGAWALLQRQYGRLQCLSSVGLLFRVFMMCVPPTASYGCKAWGHYKLTAATAASREALAKSHLHILRQISGVRSKSALSILLAEFGLMCLPDQWLLRAATFWNALAALPPTSLYKRMDLDASPWAKGVSSAVRRTGYHLPISQGDMVHIDIRVLSAHLRQCRDAVWEIWTFALGPVLPGTPACAHIKTGRLGLQTAMLGHFWTCPFPCAAYALHAPLLALRDGLPQATEGYRMLASCAKTRQNLYDVPAGCLRR